MKWIKSIFLYAVTRCKWGYNEEGKMIVLSFRFGSTWLGKPSIDVSCVQVALAWRLVSEYNADCALTWDAALHDVRWRNSIGCFCNIWAVMVGSLCLCACQFLQHCYDTVPPRGGWGLGLESTQIPHFSTLFLFLQWYRVLPTVVLSFGAWVYLRCLLKACKCDQTQRVRPFNPMLREKKSIIEPVHI